MKYWHKDLTYQNLVLELDEFVYLPSKLALPKLKFDHSNPQVSSKTIFYETEGTQETIQNVQVE